MTLWEKRTFSVVLDMAVQSPGCIFRRAERQGDIKDEAVPQQSFRSGPVPILHTDFPLPQTQALPLSAGGAAGRYKR